MDVPPGTMRTPREWGNAHRIGRFAERLEAGESVAASVYAAGFGASSRAYEAAPNGLVLPDERAGQ